MRTLIPLLVSIALALSGSPVWAQIYECPDSSGGTEYTNEPRDGCKKVLSAVSPDEPSQKLPRASADEMTGTAGEMNGAVNSGQVKDLERSMLSDPEIMKRILSLKDDPEFMKIMQDPEIMKAVQAGDVSALKSNPKFMQLLNNKNVQAIQEKVLEKNP